MLYSSNWLLDEVKNYTNQNGHPPTFVSNWDSEPGDRGLLGDIVKVAVTTSASRISDYLYGEDLFDETSCLLDELSCGGNLHLEQENIAITLNATNALYLSINALQHLGASRFLVITPTYYSVLETLASLKATVVYHHLMDKDKFALSMEAIHEAVKWQQIDAIILTDPIYSSGIELDVEVYKDLSVICRECSIWLICDYALGGLLWHKQAICLLNTHKIAELAKLDRFIHIESLPKRLVLNGVKHAVVTAPVHVTRIIYELASRMSGGFCASQLSLLRALHNPINKKSILAYMDGARERIRANFALLQASALGTCYYAYPSNSGHFTMLCHKYRKAQQVDSKEITKRLLWHHGLYVLPSEHFSYYRENRFGIRINLMNDMSSSLIRLNRALTEDSKLLDAFS